MYSLERLVFQGTGRCPQYRWKQFAVCGSRDPLDKIRSSQQRPDEWRVIFMPCRIEDVIKSLEEIA